MIRRISDEVTTANDSLLYTAIMRMSDVVIVNGKKILLTGDLKTQVNPDSASVNDRIQFTVTSRLVDSVLIDDIIGKDTTIQLFDEVRVKDKLVLIAFPPGLDSALINDFITVYVIIRPSDTVTIQDTLGNIIGKKMSDVVTVIDYITPVPLISPPDSATVRDSITKSVTSRFNDTVLVDDQIGATTTKIISDGVTINDRIVPGVLTAVGDAAIVSDVITVRVTSRFGDRVLGDELVTWTLTRSIYDRVLIDDIIRVSPTVPTDDAAIIQDVISIIVTYRINDAISTDDILAKIAMARILDVVNVDDSLNSIQLKRFRDSVSVQDKLRTISTMRMLDEAIVEDTTVTTNIVRLSDVVSIEDKINLVPVKKMYDAAIVSDTLTKTVFSRPVDAVTIQDKILKLVLVPQGDRALVNDVIRVVLVKKMYDVVTVSDTLSKTQFARVADSVVIQDDITTIVYVLKEDRALVNDVIRVTIIQKISDSVTVSDTLTKTVFSRLDDVVTVQDDIITIVYIVEGDRALVNDVIRVTIIQKLKDSVTVSDTLTKVAFARPDDLVTIQDDITKIIFVIEGELVLVNDVLRAVQIKRFGDSATVSDTLTKTVFSRLDDVVTIQDDITKIIYTIQGERVLVNDVIRVTIIKKMKDSASVSDTLTKTVFSRPDDRITVQDDIRKLVFSRQDDRVLVNDVLRAVQIKRLDDAATVSDTLTKTVFSRPADRITVQDDIKKLVLLINGDRVLVNDVLRAVQIKRFGDSTTVSDTLTKTVFSRLDDVVTIQDDIRFITTVSLQDSAMVQDDISRIITRYIQDESLVQDTIQKTVFSRPDDIITVQDSITKTVTIRIFDESSTVEDIILVAPATFRPIDTGSVQDTIRKIVTYRVSDTASVQDSITWIITRYVQDTATVQDSTIWKLTRPFRDITTTQDAISITPIFTTKDAATTQDSITPFGSLNIETRENGVLVPGATTYRVIPDPFTGTGSLVVTDGGINDNDGTPNNGQINVFPVPLDTYRINQTSAPAGYFSLINFTYATVHITDINATALFSVFDKTDDPADVVPTNSDILDIANYTFDSIENKLFRVDAGVQTPIDEVDQMPEPIFIGANDPADPVVVAEAQPTLLYKNLGLNENETPEDVRNAFGLAPYDAGNFTETTFVGVFAATEQTSSGQYLSTIPHDSFNCGQRYVYSLDDTLVPTYGGMTRFDITTDITGTCPESEDYITFEVTSAPTAAGVPKILSGQDSLLYVNPQYPRGSVTADGVDFSSAGSVTSIQFKLITSLPETENIDDIKVYIFDTNWTSNGVDIVSQKLITLGPNTGMVELIVSATHLGKLLVTGSKILGFSGPSPTGTGPIGVDIGAGSGTGGGGGDITTAKVHRIDYDVCTENISRILVSHDSSSPPRVQLLTTKLGIIDATLSEYQPFAAENLATIYDRYLFEAPLAHGETIFTVFAIDRNSNVQRTLVEVEGCTGTLFFVEDQIVLPDIFDVKYRTQNSTAIRVDSTEHNYIEESQDLEVSAIINSPIVPLAKADLYVKTLGGMDQTILPMEITPLPLPTLSTVSIVSATIPEELLHGPAVEFWIRLVTEEGVVKESKHSIVGIKPDNYSEESSVEMDTVTIKAQGTTLYPTAYLTNEAEIPVYSTVSLVADGDIVESKPVLLTPGQNRVTLEWNIPKSADSRAYSIQALLEVYDTSYITGEATLNTFVRTQIIPITQQEYIESVTDESGNTIARPAMLYASNSEDGQFRVTAPDGTCVIGTGCLVEQSTLKHRGAIDSVILDGQIFRVRYSGADNALERFSITSLDSVLGEWKVEIEDVPTSEFVASAMQDVPIKVKYRAERSPLVTVTSE